MLNTSRTCQDLATLSLFFFLDEHTCTLVLNLRGGEYIKYYVMSLAVNVSLLVEHALENTC